MVLNSFRLVTWNVRQGTGKRRIDQIDALKQLQPDLVALQEARVGSAPLYREGLAELGLPYACDSFALAPNRCELTGPQAYGEVIASRWPLCALPPTDFPIQWPERVLSAIVASPCGPVEIHTTHIPPGSTNGLIKVDTLEGIYQRLAVKTVQLRILCGDFNTPQEEGQDGYVMTWAQRRNAAGARVFRPPPYGERWDAAERVVLSGLGDFDLPDVHRSLHGYGASASGCSWVGRGRAAHRRYDHVFASARLGATEFRYLHELRIQGLSDHAAVEVVFTPKVGA